MTRKEQIEKMYESLCTIFGVNCSIWDALHCKFSRNVFCPENQKFLIAEYLMWEDFVRQANRHGVHYYVGIDDFLKNFHDVVYDRVKIDE